MKEKALIAIITSVLLLTLVGAKAQDWVEYEAGPQAFIFTATLKYAAPGTFFFDWDTGTYDKTQPQSESTADYYDANGNNTKSVYTYSDVPKALKYGNADLIRELNDQDLLDGTTSGWSLVALLMDESPSWDLVARKKVNGEIMDVPVGSIGTDLGFVTGTYTDTTTRKFDADGFETSVVQTIAGAYSFEGSLNIDLGGLQVRALYAEKATVFAWYPDITDKSTQSSIILSGGGKLTAGLGPTTYEDPNTGATYDAIISATGSLGKAAAVKVIY